MSVRENTFYDTMASSDGGRITGEIAGTKLSGHGYEHFLRIERCFMDQTRQSDSGSIIDYCRGKACVDFAVSHGLQYIEYDAGWYGREEDGASDASAVHLDPRHNPDPTSLNLQEVIDYGISKWIGTILYVNHTAMEKQLDEILPTMKNGV